MVLFLAIKDLLIILKDKQALLIILLMPLIIIVILGNALGFMFEDEFIVDKFEVAVVNSDHNTISDFLIDDVLNGESGSSFDTRMAGYDEAENLLQQGKVKAIIFIPEKFTTDIENQKEVQLMIKAKDYDEVEIKIVSGIVDGFAHRLSTGFAGTKATMEAYFTNIEPIEGSGRVMSVPKANEVMIDLLIEIGSRSINYKDVEYENLKRINGVQYYAATILIMFMLFGASFGVTLFIVERELTTLKRLVTIRANKGTLILGKFSGLFFVILVQAIILILFSRFVYGVHWGHSFPGIVLVTLSSVFASSSMGMFIACIVKTRRAAMGISQLIIHVFNILGGGMVPLRMLPDIIRNIGKVSLNWWSATAYHNLMMGYSLDEILPYCLVLLGMSAVYLTIGILRFRID